jgi:hypothetical protein
MGDYFDVVPLQLQGPTIYQSSFMLTGKVPMSQGRGSSSKPQSTLGRPTSSIHLEDRPEGSPPNTFVVASSISTIVAWTVLCISTSNESQDVAEDMSKPTVGCLHDLYVCKIILAN